VVERWTSTGTHEGEFIGVAPTGNTVTVEGIDGAPREEATA
jgi:hypothetical protein